MARTKSPQWERRRKDLIEAERISNYESTEEKKKEKENLSEEVKEITDAVKEPSKNDYFIELERKLLEAQLKQKELLDQVKAEPMVSRRPFQGETPAWRKKKVRNLALQKKA